MKKSMLVLMCSATLMACKKKETTSTGSNTESSQMTNSADNASAMDSTTIAGTDQNHSGDLSEQDKSFANEAAKGGMMEVMLGKLAEEKGTNAKVKEHGQMMVRDHTKANEELKAWARKIGYTLPAEIDAEQKKVVDELKAKTGAAFDKAYTEWMVLDHEKTIDLFKKQSNSGKEESLKAFASKTLSTLEQHLKHTFEARDAVK